MRDPARIDTMLAKLGELWRRWPNLRLGQLVYNLADEARNLTGSKAESFHIEDGDMLAAIEAWLVRDARTTPRRGGGE